MFVSKNISDKIIDLLTGWFGVGSLPGPKGTWGSLAALPFAWLILNYFSSTGLLLASLICCFIGMIVVDFYTKRTQTKDPSFAVIDEVAGQWLTLSVLDTPNLIYICLGFLLFRLFDITKPPPCRQFEKIPGGLGVMLDDIAAGIYAAMILLCVIHFDMDFIEQLKSIF